MQLEILENKVKFVWGLGCFEIASELLKVDTIEEVIFSVGNTANMARVAYAAVQNGCEIEGNNVPFTLRQFQAWLNDQPEQVGIDIVNDFQNSVYQGRVMKDRYDEIIEILNASNTETAEPVKKKVTRKSVK